MGMSCKICKNEHLEQAGELDICESINHGTKLYANEPLVTPDGLPQNTQTAKMLHHTVKESPAYRPKLVNPRVKPRPPDSGLKAAPNGNKEGEGGRGNETVDQAGKAEAKKEEHPEMLLSGKKPTVQQEPEMKRQSSLAVEPTRLPTLQEAKGKQETPKGTRMSQQMLGVPVNKMSSKISCSSLCSVAFDPACLVMEKKGSIYDEYTVLDVLGKGAFGEVKKVEHKSTHKIYAMKIINRSLCSASENLLNEIEILKKLVRPRLKF
jgi:hypothetical protein